MLTKILWTGLVTVLSTTGAILGYRLADALWHLARKEDPPPTPGWARFLVGRPLHAAVGAGMGTRL